MSTERLVQRGLDFALTMGAREAELFRASDRSLEIEVAQGEVETLAVSESSGMGCRVFTADGRMGFAYTTSAAEGIEPLVEEAWQNALANDVDEFVSLYAANDQSDDDWSQEDFESIPLDAKIELARRLEQDVLAADQRVQQVQQASYTDSAGEILIANTHGLRRRFRMSQCSCSVVASAAEDGGDGEMNWEFDAADTFNALRADWVARTCAKGLVRKLGGKPVPTKAMPAVFDNYVAAQAVGVLVPALKGSAVVKGRSRYADKLGEGIASENITIIDQNDAPKGLNRAPFDGEGVTSKRILLIEDGILRCFLHNLYTARKRGDESTANAGRGGFRGTPEVSASNLYIEPGNETQETLIEGVDEGLFVTGLMGVHTADPISGDFSFGAEGLVIRKGALAESFRGVTIAGNIGGILQGIVSVGSDLRFFGSIGAPSVLISNVMVSGT